MKAWELREAKGIDGLACNADRAMPQPGPGEVLVKVRATSLNYRDLLVAAGRYGSSVKPSVIPLSDGAGEVVALGAGASRFKAGDRVVAAFFPNWAAGAISAEATAVALGGNADGMLAEYVVLPESGLVEAPAHLSFEEAATLPCAALTAWNAVVETGRVKAGDVVLLLGTGGVSLFALQIAKLHGARVILLSSSDAKLERARALGADLVVNYRAKNDWDQEVRKLTEGRGVDLVVEVGGAGTMERSVRAVRVGGTIAVIGVVAGPGQLDPRSLITRAIRLQGVYVGSREMFATMNRAIANARLRPVIDRTLAFDDAKQAYAHLSSGAHFGKVVVKIDEEG